MLRRKLLAALLFISALVGACASGSSPWQTPEAEARALLAGNGFELLASPPDVLAAVRPSRSPTRLLTVFIEGDGAVWPRPSVPPADPTPDNPLALRMAVSHLAQPSQPGEVVAYMARPCQYLQSEVLASCPVQWWTTGRLGAAPLALLNERLDQLKLKAPGAALRLVGYSGGGAVAALLAEQRRDIACLVTVAAPLDTDAWTRAKNVSPLSGSRNPTDSAAALRGLPMTHFSGAADSVVPAGTNQRFMAAAQTVETPLQGFNHDSQWLRAWPSLAQASCLSAPNQR